jgi:hypothetical protein
VRRGTRRHAQTRQDWALAEMVLLPTTLWRGQPLTGVLADAGHKRLAALAQDRTSLLRSQALIPVWISRLWSG